MALPSTLRIGISGFGRLAREYYVPILNRIAGVTLVAVADPLLESRMAAKHLLPSVRTYIDFDQMCAQEELEAMLVASPPSSHLDAWAVARARGLATFIEKPLGLVSQLPCVPHLNDVEAGLMLNFNRRFWPAYRQVCDAVASGYIGQLRSIDLVLQTNARRWSTVTQHRMSPGEGGVLHDLGSQALDVVCEIIQAEPVKISACVRPSRYEQLDLQMEFANGASARCRLGYSGGDLESLVIVGSDKNIIMRAANMAPHITDSLRLPLSDYISDYVALGYRVFAVHQRLLHYTMTKALAQFTHALRTNTCQRPGYGAAVANLRLLARAAESMHSSSAQLTHG